MTQLEQTGLIFDIDGVIRDVAGSYRRALADTVEHFTGFRPSAIDIDQLKAEGIWNNDWEASQELIRRYFRDHGDMEETQILPTLDEIISFFQSRYRGIGNPWDGYITQEPLLVSTSYFQELQESGIKWGFFSGATRASAVYVLSRLGLANALLVAMEDAPSKPNPEGLFKAIVQLPPPITKVIYAGDTVADMLTVVQAKKQEGDRDFLAVGIIPPHVESARRDEYRDTLLKNGADLVLDSITDLKPATIADII
jgi:HAD superfamily phosphatase